MMKEKLSGLLKAMILKQKAETQIDKKTWIFSSTDNRKFNYNSRYLFLYVKEHLPDIKPKFVINDEALRIRLQMQYGSGYFIDSVSKEGIETILKAGVWFTSAGLPVYGVGLNKNRRIVNLWHGVPLKKIALDDPSLGKMARLYFRKIFSSNYTDVVTTSEQLTGIMSQSLGVPKELIRVWGQPRNDILFRPFNRKDYLAEKYPSLPEYKNVILYAPTFRSNKAVRLFPFEDFEPQRLEEFLRTRQILLLIRTHLEEKEHHPEYESDYIRFFNEDKAEDVMEGLQAFDLLITDYSSIYIDYMLLDRPILFLPYDLEEYRQNHGFYFDYEQVTPGAKPECFEEFLEVIEKELKEDSYVNQRRDVNRLFHGCSYPCAEKICEKVMKDMEESK